MADYLINFAYHLDPNGPDSQFWPRYNTSDPRQLTFYKNWIGMNRQIVTPEDYRIEPIQYLIDLSSRYSF